MLETPPNYQANWDGCAKYENWLQERNFKGKDLLPFWVADMDLKLDKYVQEAIMQVAERGNYSYEVRPLSDFKLLGESYRESFGFSEVVNPLVVTNGVLSAIAHVLDELTNPSDGVIIFSPVYHMFKEVISGVNRTVVDIPLQTNGLRYDINFAALEQALSSGKAKAILFCNPHNPIGQTWDKDTLSKLLALSQQYGVWLLSDEIHGDIVYNGSFNSILSWPKAQTENVIMFTSFAKTFGLSTLGEAFLFIPNRGLKQQMAKRIKSLHLEVMNPFTAAATHKAAERKMEYLKDLLPLLKRNIDGIAQYISDHNLDIKFHKPDATYQVWLDFGAYQLSAEELQARLVEKGKVALTPGTWFHPDYGQFMRMNIACMPEMLMKGLHGIKTALTS